MRITSLTLTALLCVVCANAEETQPAATVTMKRLVEKREIAFEKTDFSGWDNGIELTLHADGAAVTGARKYGKLKVTQAVDDLGTDLTKAPAGAPDWSREGYQEIPPRSTFGMHREQAPKPTGFDFQVNIPAPTPRSAKTLKLVTGQLDVVIGGEKKIVEVRSIKTNLGHAVDDPSLKAVGVTFTLVDPAKRAAGEKILGAMLGGDPGKGVSAEISGQIDAIASVKILDAAGKTINSGSIWHDEPGKRSITYSVESALPDNATLQIEVWPGQKTVTVPFELKDVALP